MGVIRCKGLPGEEIARNTVARSAGGRHFAALLSATALVLSL
jgi:hypothetical protein